LCCSVADTVPLQQVLARDDATCKDAVTLRVHRLVVPKINLSADVPMTSIALLLVLILMMRMVTVTMRISSTIPTVHDLLLFTVW
jgi:hypothetical protein